MKLVRDNGFNLIYIREQWFEKASLVHGEYIVKGIGNRVW